MPLSIITDGGWGKCETITVHAEEIYNDVTGRIKGTKTARYILTDWSFKSSMLTSMTFFLAALEKDESSFQDIILIFHNLRATEGKANLSFAAKSKSHVKPKRANQSN